MGTNVRKVDRRTVARGAAWSLPVIAVAAAAPRAAASGSGPAPNATANYFWDAESQDTYTRLDPAQGGLDFNYSTQISYQANPWASPPTDACLVVTIAFSQPVTLVNLVTNAWTKQSPSGNGPATSFTFRRCPSGFGDSLSANFHGSQAGSIASQSTMALENGGSTTWSSVVSEADASLVA